MNLFHMKIIPAAYFSKEIIRAESVWWNDAWEFLGLVLGRTSKNHVHIHLGNATGILMLNTVMWSFLRNINVSVNGNRTHLRRIPTLNMSYNAYQISFLNLFFMQRLKEMLLKFFKNLYTEFIYKL